MRETKERQRSRERLGREWKRDQDEGQTDKVKATVNSSEQLLEWRGEGGGRWQWGCGCKKENQNLLKGVRACEKFEAPPMRGE